jgi:GAF domain-containing protein
VSPDRDMTRLLASIVELPAVDDTVEQITTFAAETFRTPHAGVTLLRDRGRHLEPAGPTDAAVRQADELQDALKEGPCIDAVTDSRAIVSNDIASDPRWPAWGPRAAAMGLGSVLSLKIHAGGHRVGALNVYGGPGREFTGPEVETAQALAVHAAVALQFSERIEGLTVALDSRTTIGQAQGVLMERYAVDADQAFAILRRYSQAKNIRLVKVAQQLIAETVRA